MPSSDSPPQPGEFPFTRGVHRDMYRGRPWTMRQYAGFADAAESNQRYRYLLAQGVTGLSVAFDLPTQIGYDSDHPLAAGEVGRVGVAIDSLDDMEELFDGIPLDAVSTSMTINATAIILLAMYVALARRRGLSPASLAGTLQNDILKEYIARGTFIFPPEPSLRLVTDLISYCATDIPGWHPVSISGYHIREAGATAEQEVAFTLANAATYVDAAVRSGLDVNLVGQRISFFFSAGNGFFTEIAKFRAARRLWARTMRDQFGATDSRAQQLRCHAQTAGSTLTAQQPDNNIVRVAIQALSAVLGGAQSLHCNGRDEALALPTEESATIALRTQQILLHETGVANTVDPVGGSRTVETLTDEIEHGALRVLAGIEAAGGTLAAIQSGFIQRQIEESAYRAQQAVDSGASVIVGVNRYVDDDRRPRLRVFRLDSAVERRQIERVAHVRARRPRAAWQSAIAVVRDAALSGRNLVIPIIGAVEADATLGEIADVLRGVFGEQPT
ncbi:MAG: methylmalonyl-CoA mutase family protein [Vicinamibacterales bacterium]